MHFYPVFSVFENAIGLTKYVFVLQYKYIYPKTFSE